MHRSVLISVLCSTGVFIYPSANYCSFENLVGQILHLALISYYFHHYQPHINSGMSFSSFMKNLVGILIGTTMSHSIINWGKLVSLIIVGISIPEYHISPHLNLYYPSIEIVFFSPESFYALLYL